MDELSGGRGREQSLAELVDELESLKQQVDGLGEDVLSKLEHSWSSFHSVLYPQIRSWMERTGASSLVVYRLQADSMRFEPNLSAGETGTLPQTLQVSQDAEVFARLICPGAPLLMAHSLASRELQVDFEDRAVVFPFCLFDRVVGVFFATFEELEETHYEHLCSSTEKLLERMRREILVGRLTELRKHQAS